ncbi:MAG: hypothetical protein AB7I27_09515 [Bacteriovoracaceae bacterium]
MNRIKNINGMEHRSCGCENIASHWEKTTGSPRPVFCAASKCLETELVGVYAQVEGGGDEWYLIMLCPEHAKQAGNLEIRDSYKLVSHKQVC